MRDFGDAKGITNKMIEIGDRRRRTSWLIVLSFIINQAALTSGGVTNEGREFYVAFSDIGGATDNRLYIRTSSITPVNVKIIAPKFGPIDGMYGLYPFEAQVSSTSPVSGLIWSSMNAAIVMSGTEKSNKGIYVKSDGLITVYALNVKNAASAGFLVLPLEALGTEYYSVTYSDDIWGPSIVSTTDIWAQIGIVAPTDATHISIALPTDRNVSVDYLGRTYRTGEILNINLDQYGTFQLQSQSIDLTGTRVYSDKPIAVYSGNKYVQVKAVSFNPDHLVTQLTPVGQWETQFAVVSYPPQGARYPGDFIRIVSSHRNTVTYTTSVGVDVHELAVPGSYIDIYLRANATAYVYSDSPVQVVQYGRSRTSGSFGDAIMTLLPPVFQYSNNYRFGSITLSTNPLNNYMTIVVQGDNKDGIYWQSVSSTGSSTVQLSSLSGTAWNPVLSSSPPLVSMMVSLGVVSQLHIVYHEMVNASFELLLMGYSLGETYSFPAGRAFNVVNNQSCIASPMIIYDRIDNDCDNFVDEEIFDGIDNDGDGYIDEDCLKSVTVSTNDTSSAPLISNTIPITPSVSGQSTQSLMYTTRSPAISVTAAIPNNIIASNSSYSYANAVNVSGTPISSTLVSMSGSSATAVNPGGLTVNPVSRGAETSSVSGGTAVSSGSDATTANPGSGGTIVSQSSSGSNTANTLSRLINTSVSPGITNAVNQGAANTIISQGPGGTTVSPGLVGMTVNPGFADTTGNPVVVGLTVSQEAVNATASQRSDGTTFSSGSDSVTVTQFSSGTTINKGSDGATVSLGLIGITVRPGAADTIIVSQESGGISASQISDGATTNPGSGGTMANPGSGGTTANPGSGGTKANPGSGGTTANPGSGGTMANPGSGGTTANPGSDGTTVNLGSGGTTLTTSWSSGLTTNLRSSVTTGGTNISSASSASSPFILVSTQQANIPEDAQFDNEFILMIPPSNSDSASSLMITNPQTTSVSVTIYYRSATVTLSINQGSDWTYPLSPNRGSQPLTASVTSSDQIYLSLINYGSCASYVPLPVSALGVNYVAITWSPQTTPTSTGGATSASPNSSILITPAKNNTRVTIFLPANALYPFKYGYFNFFAGDTISHTLMLGDTMSVTSLGDITGTLVTGDQPIAVLVADSSTSTIGPGSSADQTLSQLFPTTQWGRTFLIAGIPGNFNSGYYLKIVSANNNVILTYTWNQTIQVVRGSPALIDIPDNAAMYLVSDADIHVIQYVKGATVGSSDMGWPSSTNIPSIDQFDSTYSFTTDSKFNSSLTIIINQQNITGLMLNNANIVVTNGWSMIQGSSPVMVTTSITARGGSNKISHASGAQFGAFVYSVLSGQCAICYNAGAKYLRPVTTTAALSTLAFTSTLTYSVASTSSSLPNNAIQTQVAVNNVSTVISASSSSSAAPSSSISGATLLKSTQVTSSSLIISANTTLSTASEKALPSTASANALPSAASVNALPSTASANALPSTASANALPSTASANAVPSASTNTVPPVAATNAFQSIPANASPSPAATNAPNPSVTSANELLLLNSTSALSSSVAAQYSVFTIASSSSAINIALLSDSTNALASTMPINSASAATDAIQVLSTSPTNNSQPTTPTGSAQLTTVTNVAASSLPTNSVASSMPTNNVASSMSANTITSSMLTNFDASSLLTNSVQSAQPINLISSITDTTPILSDLPTTMSPTSALVSSAQSVAFTNAAVTSIPLNPVASSMSTNFVASSLSTNRFETYMSTNTAALSPTPNNSNATSPNTNGSPTSTATLQSPVATNPVQPIILNDTVQFTTATNSIQSTITNPISASSSSNNFIQSSLATNMIQSSTPISDTASLKLSNDMSATTLTNAIISSASTRTASPTSATNQILLSSETNTAPSQLPTNAGQLSLTTNVIGPSTYLSTSVQSNVISTSTPSSAFPELSSASLNDVSTFSLSNFNQSISSPTQASLTTSLLNTVPVTSFLTQTTSATSNQTTDGSCLTLSSARLPTYSGVYYKQIELFNGLPVYILSTCPIYLYYYSDSNVTYWLVGLDLGDSTGAMASSDQIHWMVYDQSNKSFVNDDSANVVYSCTVATACSWVQFSTSSSSLLSLSVFDSWFLVQETIYNNRPVYQQQSGANLYLFYHVTSDACQYWAVSNDLDISNNTLVYAYDQSFTLSTLSSNTATQATLWNVRDSTMATFRLDKSITLTCNNFTVT